MPSSSSDPRDCIVLADAPTFLLGRVAEHLQRQAEPLQSSLAAGELTMTSF